MQSPSRCWDWLLLWSHGCASGNEMVRNLPTFCHICDSVRFSLIRHHSIHWLHNQSCKIMSHQIMIIMTSSYRHNVIGCSVTRSTWFSSLWHRIWWINYERFIFLLSSSRTPEHLQKDCVVFLFIYFFGIVILFILDWNLGERAKLSATIVKSIVKRQGVSENKVWGEEWTLTGFYGSSWFHSWVWVRPVKTVSICREFGFVGFISVCLIISTSIFIIYFNKILLCSIHLRK